MMNSLLGFFFGMLPTTAAFLGFGSEQKPLPSTEMKRQAEGLRNEATACRGIAEHLLLVAASCRKIAEQEEANAQRAQPTLLHEARVQENLAHTYMAKHEAALVAMAKAEAEVPVLQAAEAAQREAEDRASWGKHWKKCGRTDDEVAALYAEMNEIDAMRRRAESAHRTEIAGIDRMHRTVRQRGEGETVDLDKVADNVIADLTPKERELAERCVGLLHEPKP